MQVGHNASLLNFHGLSTSQAIVKNCTPFSSNGMDLKILFRTIGTVLTGVPVFQKAYQAVGLGWLFTITTWPVLSWIADRVYDVFAKVRTLLTRGATVERLVEAYEAKRALEQKQQPNLRLL